jgi:hypothetical protein
MTYNLELANRVTAGLKGLPFIEKKMFGGVGYLLHGNMACGVHGEGLIIRVDPDKHAGLLKRPHVKPFDMTGRPMKGWLVVEAEGYKTSKQLSAWIKEGVGFALTLPPK